MAKRTLKLLQNIMVLKGQPLFLNVSGVFYFLYSCVDSAVLAVLKGLARRLSPRGKKVTSSEAVEHIVKFLSVSFSWFKLRWIIIFIFSCFCYWTWAHLSDFIRLLEAFLQSISYPSKLLLLVTCSQLPISWPLYVTTISSVGSNVCDFTTFFYLCCGVSCSCVADHINLMTIWFKY